MEVFIEFKNQEQKSTVLAYAKDLCKITACVREENQYWFKPHVDAFYDKFTDWLEEQDIEYENV